MNDKLLDPSHWSLPDPKRVIALLKGFADKSSNKKQMGSVSNLSARISPLDFYCYLKLRFGPPNGFAMTVKSPTIDNLIHWHYTLAASDKIIDIMGLNVRTEIRFHECPNICDEDWCILESHLQEELNNRKKELGKIRQSFEKWHLFINPYRRLSQIVDHYVNRLEKLDLRNIKLPQMPQSAEDFKQYSSKVGKYQALYQEASALCVCLEMICPVMGEAAVNFIALLMAKPEVKNDRRMLEDFRRRNIDVRIKGLNLFCYGFAKSIDGSEQAFKDFLKLMNRRNDVLHGNVDPAKSTGEEIFFDLGNIPLVYRHRNLGEVALSHAMSNTNIDQALRDVEVVRSFVQFLLDCLDPSYKRQIEMVLNDPQPGYRPETKRIGLIVSPFQTDLLPEQVKKNS